MNFWKVHAPPRASDTILNGDTSSSSTSRTIVYYISHRACGAKLRIDIIADRINSKDIST